MIEEVKDERTVKSPSKRRRSSSKKKKEKEAEKEKSPMEKRHFQISYFPENLSNTSEKLSASELLQLPSTQLPKGTPDYLFYVYASEFKVCFRC